MRTIFAFAALATLAACGSQEPAPEPQPTATVAAVLPDPTPSLPAPDEAIFAATFAEACPDAPKVSTSICRSHGFGKQGFTCDYGLGEVLDGVVEPLVEGLVKVTATQAVRQALEHRVVEHQAAQQRLLRLEIVGQGRDGRGVHRRREGYGGEGVHRAHVLPMRARYVSRGRSPG